jgi:hypothetical protein
MPDPVLRYLFDIPSMLESGGVTKCYACESCGAQGKFEVLRYDDDTPESFKERVSRWQEDAAKEHICREKQKPRIVVATPFYDTKRPETEQCINRLSHCPSCEVQVVQHKSGSISHARNFMWNEIVDKAQTSDYLLWVDADMDFSIQDVANLVMLDKDIATGIAVCRTSRQLNIFKTCDIEADPYTIREIGSLPFPVAAVGCAFMLMRIGFMREYDLMGRPKLGPPFDLINLNTETKFGGQMPEDLSFCKRMQDWGREIWAHPGVRLGHYIGEMVRP